MRTEAQGGEAVWNQQKTRSAPGDVVSKYPKFVSPGDTPCSRRQSRLAQRDLVGTAADPQRTEEYRASASPDGSSPRLQCLG